jgi:hypothetical protein
MLRPKMFTKPYVAFRHIPYICGPDVLSQAPASGGVLAKGQTVWTKEVFVPKQCPQMATAFVEDIGIVSLNPSWLVSASILDPSSWKQEERK